ncbi:CHASE2 domain-containing protein [Piscinibacter sp.]|jgi:CHASE2 domain-containing sensor protein|uniref:CHASE2 domain-containing protein n=1 Tax=Piscinibacter sp. TaxID=1903157 RepID=UPI002F40DB95
MFHRPRLFISYRRSDAEASAGRLFAWLAWQFGRERVFLDSASIPFGDDFQRIVRERIADADVVVAVIGAQWLVTANERGRRLDQDDDPVRFELLSALAASKRIVPVLIGGAEAPSAAQLPEALRGLATLNMAPLRDGSFDNDFDALIDELRGRSRGTVRIELDHLRRLLFGATGWALLAPFAAFAFALAAWVGLLDLLNLDTHALRLLLAAAPPPAGEPVLLVTLDAASERRRGRAFDRAHAVDWRRDHARLIERAAHAGARAVAFDLFFERDTDADAALADAARRAMQRVPPMRVVFGAREARAGVPTLVEPLRAAAAWGALCLLPRGGNAVWASPLAVLRPLDAQGQRRRGERLPADTPSLALAASVGERLNGVDLGRRELGFDGAPRAEPLRYSALQRQRLESPLCRTSQPGDELATLLLRIAPPGRWRAPQRSLSYADALEADAAADALFAGRIVLVGQTALANDASNSDVHTVFDGFTPRKVFGVELQADAIAALASGRVPRQPTVDRQVWTSAAAGLAGALASLLLFNQPAWVRRLALLALTLAACALGWWLATQDMLLNLGYDLVALWLAYGVLRALQWLARRDLPLRRPST